eukprot:1893394-Prorocentrum_lima.AAC.1
MPDDHHIEPQQLHPGQGSAMSSGLDWPGANMEGDVTVQGVLHVGQGQDPQAQYEAIRSDMMRESVLMFQAFVMEWIMWIEHVANRQ